MTSAHGFYVSKVLVIGKQWPETGAIRTTVPPSKPKLETTKIVNIDNTKGTYG